MTDLRQRLSLVLGQLHEHKGSAPAWMLAAAVRGLAERIEQRFDQIESLLRPALQPMLQPMTTVPSETPVFVLWADGSVTPGFYESARGWVTGRGVHGNMPEGALGWISSAQIHRCFFYFSPKDVP